MNKDELKAFIHSNHIYVLPANRCSCGGLYYLIFAEDEKADIIKNSSSCKCHFSKQYVWTTFETLVEFIGCHSKTAQEKVWENIKKRQPWDYSGEAPKISPTEYQEYRDLVAVLREETNNPDLWNRAKKLLADTALETKV